MPENIQEYVIQIPVNVQDRTWVGSATAQRNLNNIGASASRMSKTTGAALGTMANQARSFGMSLSAVSRSVNSFGYSISRAFSMGGRAVNMLMTPINKLKRLLFSLPGLIGLGFGVQGLIRRPMQIADQIASAMIGYETMLGSYAEAQEFMQQIEDFAMRTPFDTMGLIGNVQKMFAYGWKKDDVLRDLEIIGDTASALGGTGEKVTSIVRALGQMLSKGGIKSQEMSLQLGEQGVRAWGYLAEGLKKSIPEVQKMAEKGLINIDDGIRMILEGMQRDYRGMMEQNANKTYAGLTSQIKDFFDVTIFKQWGEGFRTAIVPALQKLNEMLTKNRPAIEKIGAVLSKFANTISLKVLGKIEKLIEFFGKLKKITSSLDFQVMGFKGDFFGQIKMIWDDLIVKPFDKWYSSGGKAQIEKIAFAIGNTLGTALGGVLNFIFGGLNSGGDNNFVSAGETMANSFLAGFEKAFNGQSLSEIIIKGFMGAQNNLKDFLSGDKKLSDPRVMATLVMDFMVLKAVLGGTAGVVSLFSKLSFGVQTLLAKLKLLLGLELPAWALVGASKGQSTTGAAFASANVFARGTVGAKIAAWGGRVIPKALPVAGKVAGVAGATALAAGVGLDMVKNPKKVGRDIITGVAAGFMLGGPLLGGLLAPLMGALEPIKGSILRMFGLDNINARLHEFVTKGLPEGIAYAIGWLSSKIPEKWNQLWDGFKNTIGSLTWWKTTFSNIGTAIKDALLGSIFNLGWWADKWNGLVSWFSDKKQGIVDAFNRGREDGSTPQTPTPKVPGMGMWIPGMAKGGIVTGPTLAVVGEAGPEAVIPLSKMRDMNGKNISISMNPVINVTATGGEEVVAAIRNNQKVICDDIATYLAREIKNSLSNTPAMVNV